MIFWVRNLTWVPEWTRKKSGTQNQSVRPIKKQLETMVFVLYYLDGLVFFTFNEFLLKAFAINILWPECCLNIWTKMFSERKIFILQSHRLKLFIRLCWKHAVLQKNELLYGCLGIDLQKRFQTSVLEQCSWQLLLLSLLLLLLLSSSLFSLLVHKNNEFRCSQVKFTISFLHIFTIQTYSTN